MDTQKLLRYVGLCKRAGGVVRGADVIAKSLAKTVCVLIASDASERTVKQTTDKCRNAGVPCVTIGADKYDLAHAVGASSPCAAVAVLAGKGPADAVKAMITEENADKTE
ncbi:MAG: ribosomal L7Ae/L30e/S12e/Gadd45 family protein [Clostridia bacterium]|nr:ribosomal L7Ae/L30e/S12e/Gadd45 family protein [Clostridia bacterium]